MAVTRERVAEQLLALRRLNGTPDKPLSQEKAAQRAKVSTRDWLRWEKKHSTPRASSLSLIADAFDISLEVFDDGANPDRSTTPLGDRLDEIDGRLGRIEALLAAIAPGADAALEEVDAELQRQAAEQSEADADATETPRATAE